MTVAQIKEQTMPGAYAPGANPREKFSLCIYGKGGVGKTTLLGTMPGRGLVIDVPQVEGGTFVLEHVKDRIDVKSVERWDDIDDVFRFLQKIKHPYQWLAIDSITAFTELAKRKTIGERALDVDPHMISLQEWGKIGSLVAELIYRLKTLDMHIIWIGQERRFGSDSETSGRMRGPDTTPGALGKLIPPCLLVGRLSVEKNLATNAYERHLRIGPDEDFYTKCRAKSGLDVPAVIRNPNIGRILKYLLGTGERPEEVIEQIFLS